MAAEPLYYVDPRAPLQVRKRPVESEDGRGSTMGFVVCTCDEDVEGAAEEIARSLNRLPEAEAILIDVAGKIRAEEATDPHGKNHLGDLPKVAAAIEDWMCS